MIKQLIFIPLILLYALPVNANDLNYTTEYMYQDCKKVADIQEQKSITPGIITCSTFINGFFAGHEIAIYTIMASSGFDTEDKIHEEYWRFSTFCRDINLPYQQLAEVIIEYIEQDNSRLNLKPANVIELAMREAFPCQEGFKYGG